MTVITLRCDRCDKSADTLYTCYMYSAKYDGIHSDDYKATSDIELCKDCFDEYKSMFDKKKTASVKETTEAEA